MTVITLTGDRPYAFALCERWIMAQTRKPDQWIVVDDGNIPHAPACACDYIRRQPQPDDPRHTMIINMKAAIPHITGDFVLIMEDDEYYAPRYIEEMAKRLQEFEIVGIGRSKYYHVPARRCLRHDNLGHASLAQTGFRRSFLPEVLSVLDGNSFLDIRMWKLVNGESAPKCDAKDRTETERISKDGRGLIFDDGEDDCLYVGIKGLPGRKGIGSGHEAVNNNSYHDDEDLSVLRKWIPEDHPGYADLGD